MLSRVANNLYWMGRYLERAEHLARYSKEIYFSSLDAPILESADRKFVLNSILYMAGIFDMEEPTERDVLYTIGLDKENPSSIISNIISARENVRGTRDVISVHLWEAINKYYHFLKNYDKEQYLTTGFYDLTQQVLDLSTVVKGKIEESLLHDEVWAVIQLGIHIEKAIQIIRVINSKLNDINQMEEIGIEVNRLSFEWSNLLKCTESFDMNRRFYKKIPSRAQVLEFILLNEKSPRSVAHCLSEIQKYISEISTVQGIIPDTAEFQIGKLYQNYRYLSFDDIKEDIYDTLNHTQDELMKISKNVEEQYLDY